MRRGAFTLVELLVVIAILSVLAAMLLPVLGKARRAAWGVDCMNRQRQIYHYFEEYLEDYDDTFPFDEESIGMWRPWCDSRYLGAYSPWKKADYSSDADIYRCQVAWEIEPKRKHSYYPFSYTYAMNTNVGNRWQGGTNYTDRKRRDFLRPGTTIMLADGPLGYGNLGRPQYEYSFKPRCGASAGLAPYPFQTGVGPRDYTCHNRGANIMYLDSHVERRYEQPPDAEYSGK